MNKLILSAIIAQTLMLSEAMAQQNSMTPPGGDIPEAQRTGVARVTVTIARTVQGDQNRHRNVLGGVNRLTGNTVPWAQIFAARAPRPQ